MSRAGRLIIVLSTHLYKLNIELMPHGYYLFLLIVYIESLHLFVWIPLKAHLILMIIILWGELSPMLESLA